MCWLVNLKQFVCVTKLLKREECHFKLVPFPEFNEKVKLRSLHYRGYHVLCHTNSLHSAGCIQDIVGRFHGKLTMLTDGTTVMARVANASVSTELHKPDETWMRCTVHMMNNAMKHVMSRNHNSAGIATIIKDFRGKKIIEDANRSEWIHLLRKDMF